MESLFAILNGSPFLPAFFVLEARTSDCYSIKLVYLVLRRITIEGVNFSADWGNKITAKSVENTGSSKSGGLFLAITSGYVVDSPKYLSSGRHWRCWWFFVCDVGSGLNRMNICSCHIVKFYQSVCYFQMVGFWVGVSSRYSWDFGEYFWAWVWVGKVYWDDC
jgi:hypothetical protein